MRLAPLVLLALAAIVLFVGLDRVGFTDVREARDAEVARELVSGGEFLTPLYDREPHFEKPVLAYVPDVLARLFWPDSPLRSRLVRASLAAFLLLVVASVGAQRFGARAGWMAAIVLTTTLAMPLAARTDGTQLLGTLLGWVGYAGLADAMFGRRAGRDPRLVVTYVALAGALVMAGPLPALWPLGGLLLYAKLARPRGGLRPARPIAGLALMAGIALPWYGAMIERHGATFLTHAPFFPYAVEERGAWFTGPLLALSFLVMGFFPWSALMPEAALHAATWWRFARPRLRPGEVGAAEPRATGAQITQARSATDVEPGAANADADRQAADADAGRGAANAEAGQQAADADAGRGAATADADRHAAAARARAHYVPPSADPLAREHREEGAAHFFLAGMIAALVPVALYPGPPLPAALPALPAAALLCGRMLDHLFEDPARLARPIARAALMLALVGSAFAILIALAAPRLGDAAPELRLLAAAAFGTSWLPFLANLRDRRRLAAVLMALPVTIGAPIVALRVLPAIEGYLNARAVAEAMNLAAPERAPLALVEPEPPSLRLYCRHNLVRLADPTKEFAELRATDGMTYLVFPPGREGEIARTAAVPLEIMMRTPSLVLARLPAP